MQTEPIAAGPARSDTSARRRAEDRENIDTLKARMRGAVASLGLPRHVTQAALALIDTWQRGKGLFPEQATIARRALYGERRMRDALRELRDEHGLITWDNRRYRGVQTSNLYHWTPAFWSLVNAYGGSATGGKQSRPQAAIVATRRRQPLPTNGDLPFSERSSLNGIARAPEPPVTSEPSTAAPASEASRIPSFSEQQAEGAHASPSPSPFFSAEDDPAFVELVILHATAHAEKWGREAQRRGEVYDPADAGSISPEHRTAVAAELRSLAARAHASALAKHRDDLTPDAIRSALTERIVCEFMALDRPYLRAHKHPLGCLWGKGGSDGKPCDLLSIGPRVLEAWCDALDPGEPPPLDALLERADLEAARAACAELRARTAAAVAAGELPATLPELAPELDDQEHDTAAAGELPAALPEEAPRTVGPLRGQRVSAEICAELERIDAEVRERAEQRRARRNRTRRRDRARLATRPRERLALLVALLALAAPRPTLDVREPEPPDEGDTAALWTTAAAPLLRDARERPARRAPRRRRAPPRRT